VLASPRIAPAPATLEEARNQPGRAEKIAALTQLPRSRYAAQICSSEF
jgi:hypothetical protein